MRVAFHVVDDVFRNISLLLLLVLAVKFTFNPLYLINFDLTVFLIVLAVFGAARVVLE